LSTSNFSRLLNSYTLICITFYHKHTEIYSLKTCLIYFRSVTNQIARIVSSRVRKTMRPIRSRVRFFFHVWETMRPIRSRVRFFFHVWETIRPIRSRVRFFFHVCEKRYVQSEAISCVTKWLLFTELRNLGIYIINKKQNRKCFVRMHFPWSNLDIF
jgi:hypothetical protein